MKKKQPKSKNRTEQSEGGPQITPTPIPPPEVIGPWMQAWLPIILNGILLFLVLAQAVIYYHQWKVMQKQAVEMKKSTEAATEAAKAAKDSVTLARSNTHLDQRAWVAVLEVHGGPPEADKIWPVSVEVKNTGKTFARALQLRMLRKGASKGETPDFTEEDRVSVASESIGLLAPNAEYLAGPSVTDLRKGPQDQLDRINSGEVVVFVFGKLTYKDIFDCPHWTTFCFTFDPTSGQFPVYGTHNDADNNSCP